MAFFAPIVVNGFFILWVAALYTGTLWLMYDTGDLGLLLGWAVLIVLTIVVVVHIVYAVR